MVAALLLSLVQISEAGRLRRLVYVDMNGASLTNLFALTNNFGEVVFPGNPSLAATDFMPPELSWGSLTPPYQATTAINVIDNYGAWVKGYFTAPETGPYTFYMTTDDESAWYMTTDPADSMNPSKTNLLCYIPDWAATTDWSKHATQTSPQVNLEQGKTYYMEIFQKEGGGGDHILLGFTPPSGITQRPMPAWHFQSFRDTRFGEPDVSVVVGPVTPRVFGGVADAGLYDGMEAVVYANVNLDPPVTYQWYKNNSPVAGATSSYYITRVSTADNNSTWKCVARSGGVDYQNETMMNVWADTEAPTVVSLSQAPFNPTAIRIVFSEAVNPAQALLPASYTLTGTTLTITNVNMDLDGKTVYLRLNGMLPIDASPTVVINGVRDFATPANVMTAYTQQMLSGEGTMSLRLWRTRPADGLAAIRTWSAANSAVPTYVNEEYSEQRFVTESRTGWDLGDNYTGQLVGFVTAPETGAYQFLICSDDHSVLYLGTNHLAVGKREIASVDGYTGQWEHNKYPSQRSASINLVKGQRYYIEAVWQDGTGGDGVVLAWRKPSTVADWPAGTAEADLRPFLIDAPLLAPKATYGPVAIKTDLPTTLNAAANTRPVISVTPDGYIPWSFQWYSNNVAIPGATTASYQFPFLPLSANGAKYKVVVTNYFSSITSRELTLSVYEDTVKPTVLSAGSALKQQVNVIFSEPMNLESATNAANYKIYSSGGAPIAITSATAVSVTNILLATGAMTEYDQARIEIRNVTDMADLVVDATTNAFTAYNFDELLRINNTQAFSAIGKGDQISLIGGGADIWGTADGMVYLYKNVTGNFDVKMRMDSLFRADNWTKAGPMFRASSANGSINWFLAATPTTGQNQFSAQVRPTEAGNSYSSGDGGSPLAYNVDPTFAAARPNIGTYPKWLRLQRVGEVFYYHYSNDGSNWVLYTWYDAAGTAPASGMVGIALTSHSTGATAEGVIGDYRPVTTANAGPIVITQQPANTTVAEVGTATFTVTATGYTPLYYQWYKGTTPITDATNRTLVLNRVPLADNNAAISVRITSPYVTTPLVSSSATLTVTADNTVPTVAYWSGSAANLQTHATEVKLIYSEPVNRADAETLSNYALSPVSGGGALTISSVVLGPDDRIVTLTLGSAQVAGTIYKVVVNNVRDLASPAKTIAANSTATYFYAGNNTPGQHTQRSDGFVIIEGENWIQSTSATITAGGGPGTTFEWIFGNTAPGYSGRGYAYVPNDPAWRAGDVNISGDLGLGALVEYEFVTTRETTNYTVWVRGWNQNTANSGADDQVHVGLQVSGGALGLIVPSNRDQSSLGGYGAGGWDWRSDRVGGTDPMIITNLPAGTHRIAFWHRDDGFLIDKIALEPGVRNAVGNSAEPGAASANGQLGQTETQNWIVAPPASPAITLVSPTNTMVFAANAAIAMDATVTPVSPVTKVDFLVAGQVVGTATTAPYTYNWANVPEGIYGVQARVTDNVGYVVTTGTATVTVDSTKPTAYAVGSLRGNGLGIYFNDLSGIDQVTATNLANYVVNDGAVTVTGARLEPDNHAVTLTLGQQLSGPFTVRIQNVADRGFGPNVIDPVTLSSTVVNTFVARDVGTTNAALGGFTDPALPGIAHAIGTDALYMRASGTDIWGNADGIHFAYTQLTGNFDVSARVYGLSRPDNWTKMGLMVREDLDGSSRNYNVVTTATNGQNQVVAQWRLVKGTASANAAKSGGVLMPNTWLRMTREAQKFTAWFSTNGVDWITWQNQTMTPDYPATVYVGLALTSHNNGTNEFNQASAYIDNIKGFNFGSVPTQPVLSAKIQGGNLVLTWSSAATYKVQESTTLGTWADSGLTPVQAGENYTVTVPVSTTGNKFYRLSP